MNPILLADGYKQNHRPQYPENTELVYSNYTPRSSRTGNKFVINFGLQYFIKKYLINKFNYDFFCQPKSGVVETYYNEISAYLNDKNFDVKHVADLHDLGYLPIKIKALPEGAKVPLQVPLFTIRNTNKEFFWLTNYIETIASNICWLPITSATTAFLMRQVLERYAKETVGDTDFVPWQGHDFSFRGMAGLEAALMSGAAHLTSFTGTDTIPAIPFLKEYYGATGLIGGSVNATEHSVMCAGGDETEKETFIRLLTKVHPKGILSIVSDTWDYFGVLTNILPELREIIMNRDGKLVIRPDSGDQVKVVCGYKVKNIDKVSLTELNLEEYFEQGYEFVQYQDEYFELIKNNRDKVEARSSEISDAEIKGTIEVLWDLFGGTKTKQGYRLLDSHIGCILGDGVTIKILETILKQLKDKGFASYNMVFGVGSYTYQYVTRDTYGMAMKATFCQINGEEKEIFKCPKTDSGFIKKSARGLLQVIQDKYGDYILRDRATWEQEAKSCLQTVFENGKLFQEITLENIRENIKNNLITQNKYTPREIKLGTGDVWDGPRRVGERK